MALKDDLGKLLYEKMTAAAGEQLDWTAAPAEVQTDYTKVAADVLEAFGPNIQNRHLKGIADDLDQVAASWPTIVLSAVPTATEREKAGARDAALLAVRFCKRRVLDWKR